MTRPVLVVAVVLLHVLVERRLLDGDHQRGLLAEVGIAAGMAQLVVPGDLVERGLERFAFVAQVAKSLRGCLP